MSTQTATTTLTDIRLYRAVHEMFRRYTNRLVDATSALEPSALEPVIRPHWEFFTAILHHHHHTEDTSIFPALVAVRPDLRSTIDLLEDEHIELGPNLDAVDVAMAEFGWRPDAATRLDLHGALAALRNWFLPHLELEDEKILPAIAESMPPKQWAQIDKAALKSIPRRHVAFAVASLDEVIQGISAGDRPAPPPPPIRLMLRLSWRQRWATFVKPIQV